MKPISNRSPCKRPPTPRWHYVFGAGGGQNQGAAIKLNFMARDFSLEIADTRSGLGKYATVHFMTLSAFRDDPLMESAIDKLGGQNRVVEREADLRFR